MGAQLVTKTRSKSLQWPAEGKILQCKVFEDNRIAGEPEPRATLANFEWKITQTGFIWRLTVSAGEFLNQKFSGAVKEPSLHA